MYKYEIEINGLNEHILKLMAQNPSYTDESSEYFTWMKNSILANLSPNAQRAYKEYYDFTPEGIKQVRFPSHGPASRKAERIDNPYLTFDEHYSGLYFIGCVGCNPITKEYQYCVKVGRSNDIGNRLRQHAGSNPLLFHNRASFPYNKSNISVLEGRCHEYLDKVAIGMPTGAEEWWFVSEETYMELCDNFSNPGFFEAVAKGVI